MRYTLMMIAMLTCGCRSTCCAVKKKQVKHSFETGVATSLYPNAPDKTHPHQCEKVDLTAKMKWEW